MRRIAFDTLAAAVIAAALCAQAAAQSGASSQTQQTPQSQAAVGAGAFNGSTYTNEYFRMSLTVPEGWNVYDARGRKMLLDKGREYLNAPDEKTQAGMEASISNTVVLLTASKQPQDVPGPDNAIFICAAEPVAPDVIKTGADYVAALKKMLPYTKESPQAEGDAVAETIGGADFGVLTLKRDTDGGVVRQTFWATVRKGHALYCVSTYTNEDDRQLMNRAMHSLKLR
jgi:hypothetical protein